MGADRARRDLSLHPPDSLGTLAGMEVYFTHEEQTRLSDAAARTGQAPEQIVREAVARYFEYETWFREAVEAGLESANRGELLDDEEVFRRLEQRFGG